MEKQIKEFIDYLFYIGLTSIKTSPKIIQIISKSFSNIQFQEITIDQLVKSLLHKYLSSIDKNDIVFISNKIYDKYNQNKYEIKLKKHLKTLFFNRKTQEMKII